MEWLIIGVVVVGQEAEKRQRDHLAEGVNNACAVCGPFEGRVKGKIITVRLGEAGRAIMP